MEHLRCVIERITYQNPQNGLYRPQGCREGQPGSGHHRRGHAETHVGSVLSLEGFWKMDAKYGRQFSVEKFEETLPATVYGIEKYLGSGLVKGVGPKFAKRIVQKFGKDTLDVIEEHPDSLLEVEGIGKVRVERIKRAGRSKRRSRISCFFSRAMRSAPPTPRRFSRPTAATVSALSRTIPTAWRMISGVSASRRRTRSRKSWESVKRNLCGCEANPVHAEQAFGRRTLLCAPGAADWQSEELLEVEAPELEMTLDEMLRTQDVIQDERRFTFRPFIFRRWAAPGG